jgi:membrane-bound lytic murein transglycosylase D
VTESSPTTKEKAIMDQTNKWMPLARFFGLAFISLLPEAAKTESAFQASFSNSDSRAITFENNIDQKTEGDTCFQTVVENLPSASAVIKYFHCPHKVFLQEGEPFDVTSDFKVTPGIVRKFHLWKRIYGFWGKNEYVIHSSEFPEVILAVVAHEDSDGTLDVKSDRNLKKAIEQQKRVYRDLLNTLHRQANKPIERLSHAHLRIARLMEHIEDPKKYQIAAHSIRAQRGQSHFVKEGIVRSGKYLPYIENEFAAKGLPIELTILGFVESSFNPKAISKVGASGVYQIMPATGRPFLIQDFGIDERNDPIKAGQVAATILDSNYASLKSWPLAVTAYNHGASSMRRAVRQTKSTDLDVIIKKYNHKNFGFASRNFYAEFLAMVYTKQNATSLFPDATPEFPIKFREEKLSKATPVKTIIKDHDLSTQDILQLNLDLSSRFIKNQGVLPKGYRIKLPAAEQVAQDNSSQSKSSPTDSPITKTSSSP